MNFADAALHHVNETPARTENGMKARATSASHVLDLFGKIGSARGVDLSQAFSKALTENEELTIRMLLWARDIREGAGERQTFRTLLATLDQNHPTLAGKIMHLIPVMGRWDDLFTYTNPINRQAAFELIRAGLADKNALAAKWMPRKGPVAVELTKFLELTPRAYRKLIVGLTNVVETQMCARKWDEINFSHVPSMASARYQKAFGRNATETYTKYLQELEKPVEERAAGVKINAGAIFPHDIVRTVATGNKVAADAQWAALPNYVGDARILPMVDVSGSMGNLRYCSGRHVQPIEVAVALGLYLSEKNTSSFKDMFMTFSTRPQLQILKGTLSDRINQMERSAWTMGTDLHAAFQAMLDIAITGNVSAEDMPESILVLSDMQFNSCARYDDSAQQMIARKYAQAGYAVPKIIFWNLNAAYGDNTPVKYDDKGVCHVSGFNPTLMKTVLGKELEEYTPYNVMVKTLNVERYDY
jgi:hypothetical protein